MSRPEDPADAATETFTVPKLAYDVLTNLLASFIGSLLGSGAVFLWWLVYREPVLVHLGQSKLGEHCAMDIWKSARGAGWMLAFEPPATENMAICGPHEYMSGDPRTMIRDYVTRYQFPCFLYEGGDLDWIIRPNLGSKEVNSTPLPDGREMLTCRCEVKHQIPLLLEKQQRVGLCGLRPAR